MADRMTEERFTQLKGGLMNPSCKTLARDSALELCDEIERLQRENAGLTAAIRELRASVIKAPAKAAGGGQ